MKHEGRGEELKSSARLRVWMAESLVTVGWESGTWQSTLTVPKPHEVFIGIYWRNDFKWDRKAIMTFPHMPCRPEMDHENGQKHSDFKGRYKSCLSALRQQLKFLNTR